MTAWAKTAAADAEKGVPKRESTAAAAGAAPSSSSSSSLAVDFYSQKNCAAQYNLLLKLVEPATPHGRRTKRYVDEVLLDFFVGYGYLTACQTGISHALFLVT